MVNKIIAHIIHKRLFDWSMKGLRKEKLVAEPIAHVSAILIPQACVANRGISWGLSSCLEYLDYANDICLLSHKYSNISLKLQGVSDFSAQTELKIYIAKTKPMCIDTTETLIPQIAARSLEKVDEFCHLGSIIKKNGGSAADIRNRLSKVTLLDKVLRVIHISRRAKLKIFEVLCFT